LIGRGDYFDVCDPHHNVYFFSLDPLDFLCDCSLSEEGKAAIANLAV
jgi:hypothetical protein